MSTNMTMQKSPNGISEEMSAGTGTYKPGASQQDHSPAMTYTDAEGAMRTEPACSRCVERFTWTNGQRSCIANSLKLIALLEQYETDRSNLLDGGSEFPGRDSPCMLLQTKATVEKTSGLYALDLQECRMIHGALLMATAANVYLGGNQGTVAELLRQFKRFDCHLHNHHRRQGIHTIPEKILDELEKPHYVGRFDLPKVVRLSDKLRGRTLQQIETWCQQQIEGLLEELRKNIATHHGGKQSLVTVLEPAMENALDIIRSRSAEWLERARTSTCCEDLLRVAEEVHEQVFLIDELMGLGCPVGRIVKRGVRWVTAVDAIESLIDWDECPNLARFQALPETDDLADW